MKCDIADLNCKTLCVVVALLLAACGGGVGNPTHVSPGNSYTVGGTVSGLSGSVVLQNNHGDNLTVAGNVAFTFATPVASGSAYSVAVLTQPSGQSCSVTNGTGTISSAAVTNVAVSCTSAIPPTVSVAISPAKTAVATGGTQDFICTIKGSTDLGCSFSVLGTNSGTVSAAGHYVAPSTAGTYTVVATSHADGSKTDIATVNVSAVASGADPTKPDVPQGMDVTLSVDTTAGQHPISPYIFGINGASSSYATFNGTGRNNGNGSGCAGREFEAVPGIAMPAGRFGANRFGANRSPWNWETDISSAGMDAPGSLDFWESDTFLCTPYSHSPAGAAKGVLEDAITTGTNAAILTMPMIGWVPKAGGTVSNPVAADVNTPATSLDTNYWVRELPARSTVTPANAAAISAEATATPNIADAYSYQEDFVKWLDAHYGAGNSRDGVNRWTTEPGRIVVQLDNEPDLWGNDTHPEVRGVIAGGTCNDSSGAGCVFTGYDELVQKTIDHAAMTKSVAPDALVMGGSWATWTGLVKGNPNMPQNIQAWATAHGDTGTYDYYAQYYLKKLHDAETTWASVLNGRRLVDIFDFHPYVQSNTVTNQDGNNVYQTTAVVNERIDYARTFWDPSYVENSWVPGSLPDCANGGGCAVQMVPRFKKWMTDAGFTTWPDDPNGMKIGFTEWALYRQGDVSNAVGVADILGVFAREGVYLSTYWPMGLNTTPYQCTGAFANAYPATPTCPRNRSVACLHAAYKAWRAFDGANGANGDTYVKSTSSDPVRASVYGTMNAGDTSKAVIIALNRRDMDLNVGLSVANLQAFHKAQWYQVTGGNGANASCSGPNQLSDVNISLNNAFTATLPAYSINVFVLTP